MIDQSFDGRAEKFARNIYQTEKGRIRTTVLWRDLQQLLPPEKQLRVLDAGGGFGFFSQKLAALGHEVVLCDLSAEMLALAERQLAEAGLSEQVVIVHAPFQSLGKDQYGQFDLILCHAVAEWLAEPLPSLAALLPLLNDDGTLSLMFYNATAQRFHNLVSGNFDYVENNLKTKKVVRLTPPNPLTAEQVEAWCEANGLVVNQRSGIRVIHDYIKQKDRAGIDFEKLLAMELQYSQQSPYWQLGRYIHFIIGRG